MTDFDVLKNLVVADRSIRRYDQSRPLSEETLLKLIDLARMCPSGRNLQPMRYRPVVDVSECRALFPALAWAGYYKDWAGPAEGERPVAYLVQCVDTSLTDNCMCDDGLQLEAIRLGATALGIGSCIIKAFNRQVLTEALGLPQRYDPRYVVSLGYPAERAVMVELGPDGDYRYYRDADSTQCVPKRSLSELIISR